MKDPCLVNLALALNAIKERPTHKGWDSQSHDDWLHSWGSYFSQVRDALLDFSAEVLKENKEEQNPLKNVLPLDIKHPQGRIPS